MKESFDCYEQFKEFGFKDKLLLINSCNQVPVLNRNFRYLSSLLLPIHVVILFLLKEWIREAPAILLVFILFIFAHVELFRRRLIKLDTSFKRKYKYVVLAFNKEQGFIFRQGLFYFILYYLFSGLLIWFFFLRK